MLFHFLTEEFGNEGSRTHVYGVRAKHAVQNAREQVAAVVAAKRDEVIFTSGATESNNLAILGLREFGRESGKRHVITTGIEHKAVLEPMQVFEREGFEVTCLPVTPGGFVTPESVAAALRPDTLLVSVMQANNETGIPSKNSCLCSPSIKSKIQLLSCVVVRLNIPLMIQSHIKFGCLLSYRLFLHVFKELQIRSFHQNCC